MPRKKHIESDYEKRLIRDYLKELGKYDDYYNKILRLREYFDNNNNITYEDLAEFMDTEDHIVKKFFTGKGRKSRTVPRINDFEYAMETYLDIKEAG